MKIDIPVDVSFYTKRLNYYATQYYCELIIGDKESGFKNSFKGKGVRGYGEIEFYLDIKGYEETVKYWKEALEWYKKVEVEGFKREYLSKYCSCDKPVCKECGKGCLNSKDNIEFVVSYVE